MAYRHADRVPEVLLNIKHGTPEHIKEMYGVQTTERNLLPTTVFG